MSPFLSRRILLCLSLCFLGSTLVYAAESPRFAETSKPKQASLREEEVAYRLPRPSTPPTPQRQRELDTALIGATDKNDLGAVIDLLKQGADPSVATLENTLHRPYAEDKLPSAPLLNAAQNGNREIVHYLIANGADPNRYRVARNTALHLAACNGDAELVRYLVEHGAATIAGNKNKQLPVHLAATCERGNLETFRFLWERDKRRILAGDSGDHGLAIEMASRHSDHALAFEAVNAFFEMERFFREQERNYRLPRAHAYALDNGNRALVEFLAGKGIPVHQGEYVWLLLKQKRVADIQAFIENSKGLDGKVLYNLQSVPHYVTDGACEKGQPYAGNEFDQLVNLVTIRADVQKKLASMVPWNKENEFHRYAAWFIRDCAGIGVGSKKWTPST